MDLFQFRYTEFGLETIVYEAGYYHIYVGFQFRYTEFGLETL